MVRGESQEWKQKTQCGCRLPCSVFRAVSTNVHRRRSVRDRAVRPDLGDDLSGVIFANLTKWFLTLVPRQGILARALSSSGWVAMDQAKAQRENGREPPPDKNFISATTIALPQCGDVIHRISEKFATNPVAGDTSITTSYKSMSPHIRTWQNEE